jgi:hypothetical protein
MKERKKNVSKGRQKKQRKRSDIKVQKQGKNMEKQRKIIKQEEGHDKEGDKRERLKE